MRRLWTRFGGTTLALVMGLTVGTGVVATAGPASALGSPVQAREWDMRSPFAREVARRGDVDRSPYHIDHVYELQWRLKRAGLFGVRPNGVFGPKTERAVKAFQRRIGVRPTGVAGRPVWTSLIPRTTRGQWLVPQGCKGIGWHACYDRRRHQLSLYRAGEMVNSWLVRGGSYSAKTRRGSFPVYWRNIDHRSGQFGGAPMPYSQFFSGGQALHGSRNMMDPFEGHSHGCVNMYVEDARQLWRLTSDKKLRVHVYGRWD